MDQYLAIRKVRSMLENVMACQTDSGLLAELREIDGRLSVFHDTGIDFKEVVDCLDDSVMITDAKGVVIYINPAYTRNTGITSDDVLNRSIHDLIGEDKLFTGGAVTAVLEGQKSVFRLSTTYKTEKPRMGYVAGVPLFHSDGTLRQVVACSRPIMSLNLLHEDFETFVKEINAIHAEPVKKESDKSLSSSMIGSYGSLDNIRTLINHVAPTDASILITGESGVGKEVIADEIYRQSMRRDKPYVKINCASIPSHLLESELFGYEKGAFTGANAKGKVGLFEYANHGTLLLDEIGDMSIDLQVKLLRAIQTQEITRVGGTRPIKLDIRFLALTNADLKAKVAQGSFRQDLYYRLNVIPLRVPPLRERLQDIPDLCQYFIARFSKKYQRSFELSHRQIDYMKQYEWPGNIRELENMVEYMILCSAGIGRIADDVLTGLLNISEEKQLSFAEAYERNLDAQQTMIPPPVMEDLASERIDFETAVGNYEKLLLEQALARSTSMREASRKLNISAATICRKIKKYGIHYDNKKS